MKLNQSKEDALSSNIIMFVIISWKDPIWDQVIFPTNNNSPQTLYKILHDKLNKISIGI